jgi:hypothetical protein
MSKNLGIQKFERIAADPGKQWREDGFGKLISWERLATPSKVAWLAAYATVYNASFESFEQAVRDALGEQIMGGNEGWNLRGQFDGARQLLGPGTAPAAASYQGTLDRYATRAATESEKDNAIEH